MTLTIDPAEFTRLMALPARDRLDLLEFLGSSLAMGQGPVSGSWRSLIASARPDPVHHDDRLPREAH